MAKSKKSVVVSAIVETITNNGSTNTASNVVPFTPVVLSAESKKALGDVGAHKAEEVKSKVNGAKFITTCVDAFRSDGITPEMLVSPGKKGDPAHVEWFQNLKNLIIARYPKVVQEMIANGQTGLKEVGDDKAKANRQLKCKENAFFWQRQPNSVIGDIRNSMVTRAAKDKGDASIDARWNEKLAVILKQAEGQPDTKCDLAEFTKHIKSSIAVLTKAMAK